MDKRNVQCYGQWHFDVTFLLTLARINLEIWWFALQAVFILLTKDIKLTPSPFYAVQIVLWRERRRMRVWGCFALVPGIQHGKKFPKREPAMRDGQSSASWMKISLHLAWSWTSTVDLSCRQTHASNDRHSCDADVRSSFVHSGSLSRAEVEHEVAEEGYSMKMERSCANKSLSRSSIIQLGLQSFVRTNHSCSC